VDGALALAFLVTLGAGLATAIGSAIAFFTKHTNRAFFAVSMGFSAGAMIYLSFVEILPKAQSNLAETVDANLAMTLTGIALVAGMLIMALIDALVPSQANPHENVSIELLEQDAQTDSRLLRIGVFLALAIAIHNFPEGLATFLLVLEDPQIGIPLAVAVAMHNIPEGIAVSIPIYYATKSRLKAFRWSAASGLAEPAGAVVGYLLLLPFLNGFTMGILFATVAGVMVFLAVDTVLPTARNSARGHLTVYGFIGGIAVVAASLILLRVA
jgi:ZIP family zinc transporter